MTLDFGDLRRLTPVDASFGLGRGKPIDRRYIEDFLSRNRRDIRGHVLEVSENAYTVAFGGRQVTRSDILHVDDSHPGATVVADLADAEALPSARFDCFICTQTLTYIYDVPRALATVHRILRPGGSFLTTVPGISQISPYDQHRWGEYWRFTEQSLERLLADAFGHANVEVMSYGNVLASVAFLQGLCVEDLRPDELDHRDPRYQLLVAGRARKPSEASSSEPQM
jgi:SAM-dependent methyltransferase